MGERSERPVAFETTRSRQELAEIAAIPGVAVYPGIVLSAWDAAPKVARLLGRPITVPVSGPFVIPGMARYDQLFRNVMRGYQRPAIEFLARRTWALLAFPMRTGKSIIALAATAAVGSRRTLIVCPGGVKYVWIDEIAKWNKTAAIWLDGRGGREARIHCLTCKGSGLVGEEWCHDCKQLNGQSYGYKIIQVRRTDRKLTDKLYRCSIHFDVLSENPRSYCARCRDDLWRSFNAAEFIVCSFDILTAQDYYSETGGLIGERPDLPGWAPLLSQLQFDVAIIDEARVLRSRPEKDRKGKSRRDRLVRALGRVRRVWGLDGTPVGGFTRDIHGPLDALSGGLFGNMYRFDEAYCEGHKNSYGGWEADGRSPRAETELKERLSYAMYRRERSEIEPELPDEEWSVIRLEKTGPAEFERSSNIRDVFDRAIGATIGIKVPEVVSNVIDEMSEGNAVYVLTYHPSSAQAVYVALEEELQKPQVRARLRSVNVATWFASGVSQKSRSDMAKAFVQHAASGSAGVFVSTHGVMQGGLSLRGATKIHVVELHHEPDKVRQAIQRPNEVGIQRGLAIMIYVVAETYDERVLSVLGPKLTTQNILTGDKGAAVMRDALLGARESSESIWERLTAHLR